MTKHDYLQALQQAKRYPTLMEVDFNNDTTAFDAYVALCRDLYGTRQVLLIDDAAIPPHTSVPVPDDTTLAAGLERFENREAQGLSSVIDEILERAHTEPVLLIVSEPSQIRLELLQTISYLLALVDYCAERNLVLPVSIVYAYETGTSQPMRLIAMKRHLVSPAEQKAQLLQEQANRYSSDQSRIYPLYFGTNRELTASNQFGDSMDEKIHYGMCDVIVPKSHKFASIGSAWWKRWLTFDDDRLFVKTTTVMDSDAFWQRLKRDIKEDDALVFIHGYNTSFEEAAIRAAQIGFDLKIPLTAFFSWPSKGTLSGYPADTASIGDSEAHLIEFLTTLATQTRSNKIHIIAHSMGNRGLLRAFDAIFNKSAELSGFTFGQIFLAAPDISVPLFKQLARVYPEHSRRTTLYVAQDDKALGASEWVYDGPRVGRIYPVTCVEDIDTVEVTDVNMTLLGHSYIGDAEALLYDMKNLITDNTPPGKRLRMSTLQGYWKLNK